MARIGNYADDDVAGWLMGSPEMAPGFAGFSDAVYNRSRLPIGVRELARMAVAFANECSVCQNTRFVQSGELDVDFYADADQWRTSPRYSDAERIAAEFAHRFATDHVGLREDGEFWARAHEHLDDGLLTDLALSCAFWVGSGRALRVLDVGQSCKINL